MPPARRRAGGDAAWGRRCKWLWSLALRTLGVASRKWPDPSLVKGWGNRRAEPGVLCFIRRPRTVGQEDIVPSPAAGGSPRRRAATRSAGHAWARRRAPGRHDGASPRVGDRRTRAPIPRDSPPRPPLAVPRRGPDRRRLGTAGSPAGGVEGCRNHRLRKSRESQRVAISKDMRHAYLGHVPDAFLIRAVAMQRASKRQRMVTPRKVYPIDTGLIPPYERPGRGHRTARTRDRRSARTGATRA